MSSPTPQRLLHDLGAVGALVDDDRPSVDERLARAIGAAHVQTLRATLACEAPDRLGTKLSRLRQWQWSVLFAALGSGVAVSMMGLIDLIWHFRSVVSGLGAVAFVLAVFLKTRHHGVQERWLGF